MPMNDHWEAILSEARDITSPAQIPALRDRITPSMAASLWPLICAMDFVETGDPDLLEKLEPVTRGLADTVLDRWSERFEIRGWRRAQSRIPV